MNVLNQCLFTRKHISLLTVSKTEEMKAVLQNVIISTIQITLNFCTIYRMVQQREQVPKKKLPSVLMGKV
jgi:hypothetical protein